MSNAFTKPFGRFGKIASDLRMPHLQEAESTSGQPYLNESELALLASFPDAVSMHSASGHCVWTSAAARSCFNIEDNQHGSRAHAFVDCVNPQDRVSLLKLISDCADGKTLSSLQVRTMAGEAGLRVLECRASRFERGNEKSGKRLVMLVTRDVTRELERLDEARSRVDSAESSNRLKSQFISNVSHELRTPLNAIIGFSEMLEGKSGLQFSEAAKLEYAGLISQSAKHLLNVINDILDVSKIEAGRFEITPEYFDPAEATNETLKLLQPVAQQSGVIVNLSIDDDLPDLNADKRALRQIIINLVANAIKFSSHGDEINVRLSRSARKIRLEISDQGIGMDAATVEKLGSMFFQAQQSSDREYEGTGLGLSIVKGLVDLHQGTVRFDSAPGRGTTVRVELPMQASSGKPVPADPDTSLVFLNAKAEKAPLRLAPSQNELDKTG